MENERNRRVSTKERIARQDSRGEGAAFSQDDDELLHDFGQDELTQDELTGEPTPRELGMKGEEAACRFLKNRGYIVIERNWTCPAGEADIIAQDEDGTLVFIEVKTRSSLEAGLPCEAVTPRKRARYERIAGFFLVEYDGPECRVRFDVISILALGNGRALMRHYVNAFGSGR